MRDIALRFESSRPHDMSMKPDEHAALAAAQEVDIETSHGDRAFLTIIWVVDVDGTLYVRSYLGDTGRWYQRALAEPAVALETGSVRVTFTAEPVTDEPTIDAVSEAFVAKYRPGSSRDAMVAPEVLHTTLRLIPT